MYNASDSVDEYCLYLRKSRSDIEAETRGEGETLARHEKQLLDLGKRLKINITYIFREVVSGETIDDRPEIQKLLHQVELGKWKGVLVVEVERLARGDTIDQGVVAQAFKYAGTKIITPVKTYDPNNEYDEEYFEFGLFMSRREFKTINRRLQNGRRTSVSEGKYIGSVPPYGYEKIKLKGSKGYSLKPLEDQANVVRMIYELYTIGQADENGIVKRVGPSLISKKLNTLKVPPAKGSLWTRDSVSSILRNPVYNGKIKWGTRTLKKQRRNGVVKKSRPRNSEQNIVLVDGLHDRLVSEETWNLAKSYLINKASKPIPDRHKVKNPLAGLAECAKCGRKLIRKPGQKHEPLLYCQIPECKNVSSFLSVVEKKVVEALEVWLKSYKTKWRQSEIKTKSSTDLENLQISALKAIEKEITELTKQLSNLHDLLEQGIYSTETFLDRSQKLSQRLAAAQKNKADIKVSITTSSERNVAKEILIPKFEHVIDTYYLTDDPELRNNLLKEVLEKFTYEKNKGTRWHGSPDDFVLKIFPKIPHPDH
ncbi:recombinase family protein [Paenibacillus amylolyticus]|uniref:recombinase family protein n=1 Tax=Paenibacillus amylolyticus TaxID=1451 RepID=UPI00096D18CE|nr:recombinase family protein [Paenibacillus amylolyticus]OMF09583.1 recombinase family protein [Paenibacillus amylolyticus]